MAILGEMHVLSSVKMHTPKDRSRVDAYGFSYTISYAGQTPWLFYQTIKENIMFGSAYNEARYHAVLDCCALKEDLAVLPDGDSTVVGPRYVDRRMDNYVG